MMKIGITGYKGRVGRLLVNELQSGAWDGVTLEGGSVRALDEATQNEDFFVTDDAEQLFKRSDVIIDFTNPASVLKHTLMAATHKKTYVIGTTGLSAQDETALKEASIQTSILYAPNMSVGVNVMLALVEKAATLLNNGWDIEVFESHHKHKIDAPSGTALAIGHAAAHGRGVALKDVANYTRHGETGARKDGAIGFSVARGGDVVGEHETYFYGDGERLEINHIATNRALFAKGAIKGAIWAHKQKAGLYNMRDVLGLSDKGL